MMSAIETGWLSDVHHPMTPRNIRSGPFAVEESRKWKTTRDMKESSSGRIRIIAAWAVRQA